MIRIKQLREEMGYTQQELADKLKKAKSTIAMYENETRKPSLRVLKQLSNIFDCSVDYILGISEKREKNKEPELILSKNHIYEALLKIANKDNKRLLPVLGTVKAGYDYLAEENIIDYIDPSINIADPENYFGLIVKGDSMSPLFDEGDYLIVHKLDGEFNTNDICIVLINGDEATVKKVVKTDTGIELHAFNPYYPVKKFTYEEMDKLPVRIIGVVVRQIRNWK